MSGESTTRTVLGTTSTDGTAIAYERTGTGPAIVLVDGALCDREFGPGRDLAAALADRFTVYVYDRRGRGDSGSTEPYSPAREVDDLAAVIAAAAAADAGGEVCVAGQSSGAALALEAAASGVPMKRLAVYEAPYIGLDSSVDHVAVLRGFLSEGRPGSAVGHFMVKMVGAPAFVPVMVRFFPKVWTSLKRLAPTLPNDALVMDGFRVPTVRLGQVSVPTLVMGGSKGKKEMKAAVNSVAAAVPGSSLRFLEGQTHQVSPKALAPELAAFFTK